MTWQDFIKEESEKQYYKELKQKVEAEYAQHTCYPPHKNIYHAFSATPIDKVKVVILGQDPYHEPHQAHGLAFSVLCPDLPPSLINIYKEMESDLGIPIRQDGNLDYLAKQGVLLLNTSLTVREHTANSHSTFGWSIFTDNCIRLLDGLPQPIVFILWGRNAIAKQSLLTNPNHLVLTSAHPSPLSASRGFFGSHPFSRTNAFLASKGVEPIKWAKAFNNS